METLVHEGSHHATAFTEDVTFGTRKAYGRTTCQEVAKTDPHKALDNADNFCYYIQARVGCAWHSPSLSQFVGLTVAYHRVWLQISQAPTWEDAATEVPDSRFDLSKYQAGSNDFPKMSKSCEESSVFMFTFEPSFQAKQLFINACLTFRAHVHSHTRPSWARGDQVPRLRLG